ncbi:minor tail protein [Mycobacterium phage Collard]|uniref:Minor tail protein n=1 Tax=Mycobacterium phage Collard TaxID=2301704 RepID=A0A385DUX9_9CAUD|nr:minor tail protein [Mycobacterium phage Collard]AXQ63204.1 minor tail protein [Mycobacterium phage Collard]UEM46421.1 hypothetical protein SEA_INVICTUSMANEO_27 [Mycobacterium phage InvictusManeo]
MSWTLNPFPVPIISLPGWGTVDDPAAVDDGVPGWFSPWAVLAGDAGIGADAAELNALRLIVREGARGADAAAARLRMLIADAAAGADRSVVRPRIMVYDAGASADLARPGVRPGDAGAGADTALWRPRFRAVDAGLGADVAAALRVRPALASIAGVGADVAAARFSTHTAVSVELTASASYTIPAWCRFIAVVLLGAGGGGSGGDSGLNYVGNGGGAGQWATVLLERGVHIPWTAVTLDVTIGTGGSGAPTNTAGSGGGSTVISIGGTVLLIALGGTGGARASLTAQGASGRSPGSIVFEGVTYTGGGTAPSGSNRTVGQPPGGGGGGGAGGILGGGSSGLAGARGQAWLLAYQ